jgi:hypothetical protein
VSETRAELAERLTSRGDRGLGDIVAQAETAADGAEAVAAADIEAPDLVRRAQAGDTSAREELIGRLLPLVSSFARRFRTEGLDQTDLIQEGIVGLLRALRKAARPGQSKELLQGDVAGSLLRPAAGLPGTKPGGGDQAAARAPGNERR